MNKDGSQQTRLTFDAAADFSPTWSPDGTQIAWLIAVSKAEAVVAVMNADGSNARVISPWLRYANNLDWTWDGSQLAFTYDVNSDGWLEIGMMNPDGSNLHPITTAQAPVDQVLGSCKGDNQLLVNELRYIHYQGQWYLENSYVRFYTYEFQNAYAYTDWEYVLYPKMTDRDDTAPVSHVSPLATFTRGAVKRIHFTAQDVSIAGLERVEIQFKVGNGLWKDLPSTAINLQEQYFTYTGQLGTHVAFRSRARDKAYNQEPWRDGEDTSTNLYAWKLDGKVVDTRGYGLQGAKVTISPEPFGTPYTKQSGDFQRYMIARENTLSITKNGFMLFPATVISSTEDLKGSWSLLPQDNLIVNGSFEQAGPAGWNAGGQLAASVQTNTAGEGKAAAVMGQLTLKIPWRQEVSWRQNQIRDTELDAMGNLHVLVSEWQVYDATDSEELHYYKRTAAGIWTKHQTFLPPGDGSYFIQSPSLDSAPDGTVHLLYVLGKSSTTGEPFKYILNYAYLPPNADLFISAPSFLPVSEGIFEEGVGWLDAGWPVIAVDSKGGVHASFNNQYASKIPGGDWSIPTDVGMGAISAWMGQDDRFYLADQERVISRASDSLWKEETKLECPSEYPWDWIVHFAEDSNGQVYLGWFCKDLFSRNRSPAGVWSPVTQLVPGEMGVRNFDWVGDQYGKLFLTWHNSIDSHVYYKEHSVEKDWSLPMQLPLTACEPLIQPDGQGGVNGVCGSNETDLLGFQIESLPERPISSYFQSVQIPADMHKPTLAFDYWFKGPNLQSGFQVLVNDTPVFTATRLTNNWTHNWVDLTPWVNQTVTVTMRVASSLQGQPTEVFIDNVSLGSWTMPVVTAVAPAQLFDWDGQKITLKGENFMETPQVFIGSTEVTEVVWIDEHTLEVTLPGTLQAGMYQVRVVNPGGQDSLWSSNLILGDVTMLPLLGR